jgi:hypothetical protein
LLGESKLGKTLFCRNFYTYSWLDGRRSGIYIRTLAVSWRPITSVSPLWMASTHSLHNESNGRTLRNSNGGGHKGQENHSRSSVREP